MIFADEKLSFKRKTFYTLGSLDLNLTTGLFGTWTLLFYIRIVGIYPLLWAFAWRSFKPLFWIRRWNRIISKLYSSYFFN